jgi:hypothetical protein
MNIMIGMIMMCGGGLFLSSCSVTEPNDTVWEDVRTFSWPTESGVSMKYRTQIGDSTISEEEITIDQASPLSGIADHYGERMYVLNNPDESFFSQVHFLPTHDSLIVKQEEFGGEIALLAPLDKGHRWYSSRDSAWEAEIIERFAYRKVEGTVYQNVIAVKYRRKEPLGGIYDDEEWIRFYAEGIGEILTIRNVYPQSSSPSQALPRQEEMKVLVETSAVQ